MIDLAQIRQANRIQKTIVGNPRPVLKWAGGKRQLLSQIDSHLPKEYNLYFEPFVGGGALFFYLLPENATLIDNNPVLINVYENIQQNVDELIELLRHHKNEEDYYYSIRNLDRTPEFPKMSAVERASRTIYLNRCCYNGLYRVNSKGQFNVPFGKYKNPKFCDEDNLRAVHEVLQSVSLVTGPFDRVLEYAQPNDFIYFDPPYHPLSSTANFTSYTKANFSEVDQIALKKTVDVLTDRGCFVLVSNSYCEFILDQYSSYTIIPVDAIRAINSDASKRGKIKEVLVKNF